MTALLLGPVAFDRFEVPVQIGFGGRQRVHVHTLVGGTRVVDAMGAEDAPIGWSGVFSGADAVARARAVDAMRIAAVEVELAWSQFFYTVLVTSFEAQFERENWIPYRVACVVTFDPAVAAVEVAGALLAAVAVDLAAAAGFGGGDVAYASAALALPGAASAGSAEAAAVRQAISQAAGATQAQLTDGEAALATADDVLGAAAAAGAMAQAAAARGFVQRAQANFAASGGM